MIALGEQIVALFTDRDWADLLTRWMAQYVAELIDAAENSPAEERPELRKQCAEAITELWQSRAVWPHNTNPLKDFAPILATLEALHPENSRPFYNQQFWTHVENKEVSEETKKWLELIQGIDHTSRILIDHALNAAVVGATANEYDWISKATKAGLTAGADMRLSVQFLDQLYQKRDETDILKEQLSGRIDRLDGFVKLSKIMKADLKRQLAQVEKKAAGKPSQSQSKLRKQGDLPQQKSGLVKP